MAVVNVMLNPNDSGTNNLLTNENLTVTNTKQYSSIRATHGKTEGKWYWEVKIESGQGFSALIGIANNYFPVSDGTSQNINLRAYGYGGSSVGAKYPENTQYGTPIEIGDLIGVALDLDNHTLEFYKNGVSMGVSHTDLKVMGEVFPVLGATSSTSKTLTINFGGSPFTYPIPSGYRAYNVYVVNKALFSSGSKYYALSGLGIKSGSGIKQYLSNSYHSTGRLPEFAFDGDISTGWGSAETSNQNGVSWIGVECYSTNNVKQIKIHQGGSSNSIYYLPSAKLQGSNDGEIWVDIQTLTLRNMVWEEIDIVPHEGYRFFRLLANSNTPTSTASIWIVNELEFIFIKNNQVMSVINSINQDSIVKYGMDESNLKLSIIDEIRNIEKTPFMLGNGKIYEHTIDLNKNKAYIVTFQ